MAEKKENQKEFTMCFKDFPCAEMMHNLSPISKE